MAEQVHRLEVEALDLGEGIRAVGCELIDAETREPAAGPEAARAWAAMLRALASDEPLGVDFFAHVHRVRDFCGLHGIPFREPNERVLFVPAPDKAQLEALCERFADATFGVRAGAALGGDDAALDGGLAHSGVDAYQVAYRKYLFCGVCDFASGFLTLLSERLWASEVIRRARGGLQELQVEVARPA